MLDGSCARGQKILVVDDDAEWREFVRVFLDDLGYQSIEASNGADALEAIAKEKPTLVLLDLNMPGMGGEAVLERLPAHPPQIVFMTAASLQDASTVLSRGPHYYLPKGASRETMELLLQSLAH